MSFEVSRVVFVMAPFLQRLPAWLTLFAGACLLLNPLDAQAVGITCEQRDDAVLACTVSAQYDSKGAVPPAAEVAEDSTQRSLRLQVMLEGEVDGASLNTMLTSVFENYSDTLDVAAGWSLLANAQSADAALQASSTLDNELLRMLLVSVVALQPSRGALAEFDRAAEAGRIQHIHFQFGASSADQDETTQRYLTVCEKHRVSCAYTKTATMSAVLAAVPVTLRRDQPLPVFTRVRAGDDPVAAGNAVGWRAQGVVSNKARLALPVRGLPLQALGRAGQSPELTFDATLRDTPLLRKQAGKTVRWRLKQGKAGQLQRGVANVDTDGVVTLTGLRLKAAKEFTNLVLTEGPPDWKIVYTRQPRAREPVAGTPLQEAANWQHATDVGRINGGLAEADIVIDDLAGNVKVIHDCTRSEQVCVAHEARVSPDGTRIVYSVGYGNELVPVRAHGLDLGIREIPGLTHAELWVYDLITEKKWRIPHHPKQAIDRQPDWLNNEKIVFASNRAGTYPFKNPFGMHQGKDQFGRGRCFNPPYCVSQEYGYGRPGMSMHLWTMNIDGTDARNISPHEQNALAPAVMRNGDILYSCWNAHENKSFDAKSTHSNRPATAKNKWWLCRTDGNGADATVILNGHKTTTLKTKQWLDPGVTGGENRSQLRAIRSVAEIFPEKLAVTNYYRSNHVGSMGIIYGMDYRDPHVEGCLTAACYPDGESRSRQPGSGQYVPSSLHAITPYGTDQDIAVRRDAQGRPMGKAGYPAPLPNTDSDFLMTHARGSCYEVTKLDEVNRRAMRGEPTCKKAVYRVKVPVVTDPFDERQMEMIAGGMQWQAWDARAIAHYDDLYGQPLPDQPAPLNPEDACYLQVVDARKAELYASAPQYDWLNNLYQQCAFQGCAVNTEDPKFHARNLHALTVFLPEMWDFSYADGRQQEYASILNNTGHKSMATLGSQPLMADGSVKMRVPCETPIIMAGTDKDGMVIAHDVMLHSLRAGESRTCHGCHDGHSEERASQLDGTARERFAGTAAAATFPPMPEPVDPVTFSDIQPILENRCSGCHKDMTNHDGLLYSRIAQDYEQHDWAWAKKQPGIGTRTHVEHVLIKRPGKGYAVGDKLQFPAGGAAGEVAAVGPRGQVTAIRLISGGNGYNPTTRVQVASSTGQGAVLVAMTDRFDLARPYSSKWVARFARDSLLYWKCLGSRQDGRTDRQYPNDIDFGPEHVSGATPEECRLIGRWIDTGIQHNL